LKEEKNSPETKSLDRREKRKKERSASELALSRKKNTDLSVEDPA